MNQFITPSPQVVFSFFFPFVIPMFSPLLYHILLFICHCSHPPVLLTCRFRLVILPQNVVPVSWGALL